MKPPLLITYIKTKFFFLHDKFSEFECLNMQIRVICLNMHQFAETSTTEIQTLDEILVSFC